MDNEIKEVTIGCACNLGIHPELGGDTQARWLVGWSRGDWIDLRCTGVKNGRLFETFYIRNVENLGSISLSSQILWYDYLSAGVLCSSELKSVKHFSVKLNIKMFKTYCYFNIIFRRI